MSPFLVETEVCLGPLSVVRPHLDLQIHLVCSTKTPLILGWGAVWPSVCPLMVTNGSQYQLVVISLAKNMQISEPRCAFMYGTQEQLVVIILPESMQTSALLH